jgi:hypothetical protein
MKPIEVTKAFATEEQCLAFAHHSRRWLKWLPPLDSTPGVAANMRDENKINDLKKAITTLARELQQAIEEASYRAKQPK